MPAARDAASFESDLEAVNGARKSFEKKRIFYETHNADAAKFCDTLERAMEGVVSFLQGFLPDGGTSDGSQLTDSNAIYLA